MKMMWILTTIFSVLTMPIHALAAEATAIIQGTDDSSALVGNAHFQDTDEGLRVEVTVFGAPPGTHGFHVHDNGSCEDKGNAAGGHYNPLGAKHGFLLNEGFEGAHAGDLGNIEINDAGEGTLLLVLPGLKVIGGEHNVADRTVILHEKKDDFGQPVGNAGGRIGCGIIQIKDDQ